MYVCMCTYTYFFFISQENRLNWWIMRIYHELISVINHLLSVVENQLCRYFLVWKLWWHRLSVFSWDKIHSWRNLYFIPRSLNCQSQTSFRLSIQVAWQYQSSLETRNLLITSGLLLLMFLKYFAGAISGAWVTCITCAINSQ